LTAGDLSGDENQSSYYDIEKPLVDYLKPPAPKVGPLTDKKITVFKASHHGSEFSNQSHLLDTLQPDTIVVCCNLGKHVPSPVFLERLNDYCVKNKSCKVVFTNTMKVYKQDDRFTALKKFEASTPIGNVEFKTEGEEEFASNLPIKCAVIRKRVRNGEVIEQWPPSRGFSTTHVPGLGYDIVLLERDPDDADQVSKGVRFTSYVLDSTWKNVDCDLETVAQGFAVNADAMISWLESDTDQKATQGSDYISEHYPALMRVITETGAAPLKQPLLDKMIAMFNASYRLDKTLSPWIWKRTAAADNTLNSDEKKTIFNLLWQNYYQEIWNNSIRRSGNNKYVKGKTWNAPTGSDPEPGAKAKGKRLPSAKAPTPRKKQKTKG
jgi:hypothetical protein